MEARFERSFEGCGAHRGAAASSAAALAAKAYTVGSDIVFGRGQYRPEIAGGGRGCWRTSWRTWCSRAWAGGRAAP
ncbi:MAG: DUF4157 domain-containing protein [Myxococcota bacterium]